MKFKAVFVFLIFFYSENLSSQGLQYFDTENERFWGINKNSWGGLIGGGILKFSTKVSDNMYRTHIIRNFC